MDAIWTGAVANTISSVVCAVIAPLVQVVDDVIHLERNTVSLQENLGTAKVFLEGTDTQFHHQQRSIPPALNDGFEGLRHSVDDAESVISSSQQRQGCLDRRFCKPRLCRQIRECNIVLQERYNNLRNAISTVRDIQEVVSSAPLRPEAQLQPVPESGYVGTGIKSAEMQLNTWLEADDHQFRVTGIYGMGGIGKTSLLKAVYNTYKQLKGNVFQVVIWLTVSQKFNILDLQSSIAEAIDLQLGSTSNAQSSTSNALETRKMKLFARLQEMKFLIILDDIWDSIQLEELGIPVGKEKGSKVVISTRSKDVIRIMGTNDYSIQIQPLSPIEGWQLFCRVGFKAGGAPTKSIEDIARQIAEECKGLPLALNVVAAALAGNTTAEEWHLALIQMQNVDPGFLTMYSGIDEDLFGRLKWSYDRLNDCNLQNCFLFCGAFPEDAEIEVETLVEMWIGEGLVHSRDKSQLMYAGRRYVTLLEERCLFQYVKTDMKQIKVHDIVRDLALYIAEKEEKCLFRTSQKLDEFPAEEVMDDCKRIAIRYYNDDTDAFLPTDFRCPKLGTLILAQNQNLREVPNGFFLNLTSLRVLDLSHTNITSLPESLWQLKQLQFLGLNDTKINSLPADICNLSRLQFLHLGGCEQLESLPRTMAELKNLKHLVLNGCRSLAGIPREICQLTSLNKLEYLWMNPSKLGVDEAESGMCSLKDFTNFPNLMELHVCVKPGMIDGITRGGIQEGTMATWLEMRHLLLEFDLHMEGLEGIEEELVEKMVPDLPRDMQNMKKLQTFHLSWYGGISLPNCICHFERLEELSLRSCFQLEELPPLERLPNLRELELTRCIKVRKLGITGSVGGFPMLERLHIEDMKNLQSISSSMPKLQTFRITDCPALNTFAKEELEEIVHRNREALQSKRDRHSGRCMRQINLGGY